VRAAGVAQVLRLARERAGLEFTAGQAELAAAAVRRAVQRTGVPDAAAFLGQSADSGAWEVLLEELSVGETYFFREPDQLAFLRDGVLPELAARAGPEGVRAWSAACATGEEAYTLAMLLGDAGCSRFRVLGTDVVRSRLAAAERGSYRRWSLRGVPEDAAGRWFTREGDRFRVRDEVRSAVAFAPLNLADPRRAYVAAGAWGMDLVFCRNVLIYLDDATIRHVAARLVEALAPDGWLFLGASDPPLQELVACEVVRTPGGVAYRRRRRGAGRPPAAALPPGSSAGPPLQSAGPALPGGSAPAPPAPSAAAAAPDAGEAAARVRALADRGALGEAGTACAAALDRHRDSAELLVLHSTLLFTARRFGDAAAAARRALYLDRGCAVAHLALGSALARAGDAGGARRAFRNAADVLRASPGGDVVPASGGESAARLLAVAEAQLHVLGEVA
jgi:chemotaxis protein methyltransferase CheR